MKAADASDKFLMSSIHAVNAAILHSQQMLQSSLDAIGQGVLTPQTVSMRDQAQQQIAFQMEALKESLESEEMVAERLIDLIA